MLDLNKRGKDVKKFVENLEAWIIHTLAEFNVAGQSRIGRVGIWVERPDKPKDVNGLIKEEKIAAIGVRLKKWITFHGLSINVDPDLSHFKGIVPCGIKEHGVTSLVDLGLPISMFSTFKTSGLPNFFIFSHSVLLPTLIKRRKTNIET